MPTHAKLFVILLGFIFIIVGIGISMLSDIPNVVPIGMGIIGIFLMLTPFTYGGKK
ncbi:MAG: hypothetical protein V5A66_00805 [Candidatus Thermoplasmatota archaeon]